MKPTLPKLSLRIVSSKRLTNPKTGDLTALYEAIARHLRGHYPDSVLEPQGSFVNDTFIATSVQETAPMCAPVIWKIENINKTQSINPADPSRSKYKYLITLKSQFND